MTLEHKNSILNVATNYSELSGILLKLKLVTELIQIGKHLIQHRTHTKLLILHSPCVSVSNI